MSAYGQDGVSGVGLQVIGFRNHFGGQQNGYPLATRACKSRALVFRLCQSFLNGHSLEIHRELSLC